MEPSYADNLARLRVAFATGVLPPDVGRWALDTITYSLPAAERVAQRNHYLRAAADLIADSIESKARRLRHEIAALRRVWPARRHEAPDLLTVRGCVLAALQVDPRTPTSVMHLRRILTGR